MKVHECVPILNVSDVPASLAWFERLGWERTFTWNEGGMIESAQDSNAHGAANFAGLCNGESRLFVCRDGQGSRGEPSRRQGQRAEDTGGVWMAWMLESRAAVDEAYAVAQRHGMTIAWPPQDEPWGLREFGLVHPDGHTIRIGGH